MNQWYKNSQCRDSTCACYAKIATKSIIEIEREKRRERQEAINNLKIINNRITIKKGAIIVLRVTFDNLLVLKTIKNQADRSEREVDPRGLLKTINKMSQS